MTLRGKRPSMHQTLYLTDDTRLVATSNLPDVRNFFCHADQRCQSLLQGDVMAGWIRFIALKIQTQGSAFGPGTGEAEDCAGAVIEDDPDTLFFATRTIHGINVSKIVGLDDLHSGERLSWQGWQFFA